MSVRPGCLALGRIAAALLLTTGLWATTGSAWAQAAAADATVKAEATPLRLAGIFSDHMVLQHGAPIRVWGRAPAGERVQVHFRGQARRTTAGADGRWSLTLRAAPPGGPHTLRVQDAQGRQTQVVSDIQVGEVWLCAGQSNMEWTLAQSAGGAQAVAQSAQP
jgi:sialate O-acetylesterase